LAFHKTAIEAIASERGQSKRLTTTASLKRKSKRSVDGLPMLSNDTSKRTGSASSSFIGSFKLASSDILTSPPYFYLLTYLPFWGSFG
jgi:hypothetical protein